MWELRAAMALRRLRISHDDRGEVEKALADVYNWFPEDSDFPDLKEAKILLQLEPSVRPPTSPALPFS